jgi:hypothetical protein
VFATAQLTSTPGSRRGAHDRRSYDEGTMRRRRWHPAGCGPAERPGKQLDNASIAIPLPWVERVALEAVQRGWIRLADYDANEQIALVRAIAEVLEHQRDAA